MYLCYHTYTLQYADACPYMQKATGRIPEMQDRIDLLLALYVPRSVDYGVACFESKSLLHTTVSSSG